LRAADATPDDPKHVVAAPRPRIVAVVADSVPPEVELPVANRLRGPGRRFMAARLFDGVTATIGIDPRATEPSRIIGLVEGVPVMMIHGEADEVVPVADGRRLAALAGPSVDHWVVPGAGHSAAHATAGQDYERRVTDFLRMAFAHHRGEDAGDSGAAAMMSAPGPQTGP
jgi:pimeloyl-ACP methyl ester carboxylesterase